MNTLKKLGLAVIVAAATATAACSSPKKMDVLLNDGQYDIRANENLSIIYLEEKQRDSEGKCTSRQYFWLTGPKLNKVEKLNINELNVTSHAYHPTCQDDRQVHLGGSVVQNQILENKTQEARKILKEHKSAITAYLQ